MGVPLHPNKPPLLHISPLPSLPVAPARIRSRSAQLLLSLGREGLRGRSLLADLDISLHTPGWQRDYSIATSRISEEYRRPSIEPPSRCGALDRLGFRKDSKGLLEDFLLGRHPFLAAPPLASGCWVDGFAKYTIAAAEGAPIQRAPCLSSGFSGLSFSSLLVVVSYNFGLTQ